MLGSRTQQSASNQNSSWRSELNQSSNPDSYKKGSIMERLDEFSKLLAESVSRRETLRRLGDLCNRRITRPFWIWDRLGCPAGSLRRLLSGMLQQGSAESMPGSLPRVQRQHQPTLWKLRSVRLLPHVGRLLQRNMHRCEFGSAQLRCLRKRLPRISPDLQPGCLQHQQQQLPTWYRL